VSTAAAAPQAIRSTIPARLDRLQWSPFQASSSDTWSGAGIMILGGIVEILLGINAEGKSLATVTKPLTSTAETA
jgi:hypothetical protein